MRRGHAHYVQIVKVVDLEIRGYYKQEIKLGRTSARFSGHNLVWAFPFLIIGYTAETLKIIYK